MKPLLFLAAILLAQAPCLGPEEPVTPTPLPGEPCCRICVVGKACRDSCIERTDECHLEPGCACDLWEIP
jgi:hypothetical protein